MKVVQFIYFEEANNVLENKGKGKILFPLADILIKDEPVCASFLFFFLYM